MRITEYKTIFTDNKEIRLIKEKSCNYAGVKSLNKPENIYRMLCDVYKIDKQTEEYVYLICVDTAMKATGVFEISHGSVNATLCGTREIFQKALLCNAYGIFIIHNHPTGDIKPSNNDINIYKRIKEAGELMGIMLCDNLIIGDGYYSFKLEGVK